MIRVGIIGGIGSGKSAAGKYFVELGIDVIDADHVSRNILDKNTKAKDILGWNPRPAEESILDIANQMKDLGILK